MRRLTLTRALSNIFITATPSYWSCSKSWWWKTMKKKCINKSAKCITSYWWKWNMNQNTVIFIKENTFGNIFCKMVAILFWLQCVNLREHYSTVGCRYNTVQYNIKLHTVVHWLKHYLNQSLYSQKHPIPHLHRWSMGCLLWGFSEKLISF